MQFDKNEMSNLNAITSTLSSQLRKLFPTMFAIYLPALIALCILVLANLAYKIPISDFTRDPLAVAHAPFYYGAFSNIGILLWCSCGAICLLSYFVFRENANIKEFASFTLFGGFITFLLLFDDLFQLHENIFPFYIGIGEKITFGIYAIIASFYFFRFKGVVMKTDFIFLLFAFLCFGLSFTFDIFGPGGELNNLFEEGFKFFGIVSWTAFFVIACINEMKGELSPAL